MILLDDRTGIKLFIQDVIDRPLNVVEDGLNFIEYNDQEVRTARVMGVVVSKYDSERFVIITIDDSTETISVRAFEEGKDLLSEIQIGDLVDVIGTLRQYEDETYIAPRSVWRIDDPNWEMVRTLELILRSKKALSERDAPEIQDLSDTSLENKKTLLDLIEKLDDGDGAYYNDLQKKSGLSDKDLDQSLNELLGESDIYEPKIGKFKKV